MEKKNMRRALMSKNKLKFVDGNIKIPTRDEPSMKLGKEPML